MKKEKEIIICKQVVYKQSELTEKELDLYKCGKDEGIVMGAGTMMIIVAVVFLIFSIIYEITK